LSVTFAVLMHGQPPIGTQFFIFYYTGLIPYHIFVHTSSGMSHAIIGNGAVLQLPPVTVLDVVITGGWCNGCPAVFRTLRPNRQRALRRGPTGNRRRSGDSQSSCLHRHRGVHASSI